MPGPKKRFPIMYRLLWDTATKRVAEKLAKTLKVSVAEAVRLAVRHSNVKAIRAGIRKDSP